MIYSLLKLNHHHTNNMYSKTFSKKQTPNTLHPTTDIYILKTFSKKTKTFTDTPTPCVHVRTIKVRC